MNEDRLITVEWVRRNNSCDNDEYLMKTLGDGRDLLEVLEGRGINIERKMWVISNQNLPISYTTKQKWMERTIREISTVKAVVEIALIRNCLYRLIRTINQREEIQINEVVTAQENSTTALLERNLQSTKDLRCKMAAHNFIMAIRATYFQDNREFCSRILTTWMLNCCDYESKETAHKEIEMGCRRVIGHLRGVLRDG